MSVRANSVRWLVASALWVAFGAASTPAPSAQTAPPAKKAPGATLEALYRQAEAALEKQDYAAAAGALEKYLADRPADPFAHFHLGYAYRALGRPDDAKARFERAVALDPKLGPAHLNLGLLHLEKDPQAAREFFRKAAELMPGEARPRFLLGVAEERAGDSGSAIRSYQAARQLDTGSFDIRLALGRVLLATALPREAEPEFRAALALRPGAPAALLGLAESLVAQDEREEAARTYAAYLQQRPEDAETRVQLASVLADLNRDAEALAELARAEAGGSPTFVVHKLRAELLLRQKQYAEARQSLAQALVLRPETPELRALLGRLHLAERDFPAAERELLAALHAQPDLTDALRDLAAVYYLGARYEAALQVLDKLAAHEPLTAGSWFVRAICYDKLQRKQEALAAYKAFLDLSRGGNERQDFQARQRVRVLTRELRRKP